MRISNGDEVGEEPDPESACGCHEEAGNPATPLDGERARECTCGESRGEQEGLTDPPLVLRERTLREAPDVYS